MQRECVLALDLGGTKISAAVADATGAVHSRLKFPIDKTQTAAQAGALARRALEEAGLDWTAVGAAGVIVPGISFGDSGEVWAPNLFGPDRVPLRAALSAELPLPIYIDSDRAGYVLGEQWLGAARGLADVAFVAVGTGIGVGLICGGRLVRGAGDIAGAAGWFSLTPEHMAHYSEVGCWEAEAAGPAAARRAGYETAEQAAAAALAGNAAARAALEETARWLGRGIANIVSLLNPEMVVLGGGLMQAAALLLEPLRREMLEWAQPLAARQAQLAITRLGEDAGLLGAARLALLREPAAGQAHVG